MVEVLGRGCDETGMKRGLRALDVTRREVVGGYGILREMREGLRGLVGEWAGGLEGLPSVEVVKGWEERERVEGRVHAREVRVEMSGLGFESGKCFEEDEDGVEEGEQPGEDGVVAKKRERSEVEAMVPVDLELEEFEDFVAENE